MAWAPARFWCRAKPMRGAEHGFRWESLRLTSVGFAAHVRLYRLLKGRIVGRNILILTTTGRRTMRRRSTPLFYISDGDDYVIIGSNGGEDRHPGWWHNILANPDVDIEVGAVRLHCRAHRISEQADTERQFERLSAVFGGYPKYRQRTSRELTLFRLRRRAAG